MIQDFEAHNAEVAEMWQAYHAGRPYRVPIIYGINPRYTMNRPEANPEGIDFATYWQQPDKMLQRQCEHQHWIRHNLPQDHPMGLPEKGWHVSVDLQNTYEAAWFGAPLEFHRNQVPCSVPFLREETKRQLIEQGIPDPFSGGAMARVWELYEYFRAEQAAGYEFAGRPIAGVGVPGLGTDGPVTVACNLRGASEFFTDLLADPGFAQEFLAYLVEATIARIRAFREFFGQALRTQSWGFADDSVALLSLDQYRQHILPHHRRLMDAFSDGGPNTMHLCGDASHLFVCMRDELNIKSFDTGFPIDHGQLRQQLGDDVQIQGGPSVPFLISNPPEAVREETRRILQSGVMRGGRFILREGNNLAPEISVANVEALYQAGRDFGQYDQEPAAG